MTLRRYGVTILFFRLDAICLHGAELKAFCMSSVINADNPVVLRVPLLAFVAILTTLAIASVVLQPTRKPYCLLDTLPELSISPFSLALISCSSFPNGSRRQIDLYQVGSSAGLSQFFSKTSPDNRKLSLC